MIKLLTSIILFVVSTANATTIINISDKPDCVDLKSAYRFNDYGAIDYNKAVDYLIKNGTPPADYRITHLTPKEAKEVAYDYIQQKITGKNFNIDAFFTEENFGIVRDNNELSADPQTIINNDYNLCTAVKRFSDGACSIREIRESVRSLSLRTLLLKREQVHQACLNNQEIWQINELKDSNGCTPDYPNKMQEFFSSQYFGGYFGVPDDFDARQQHFLTNTLGFFDKNLINSILESAQTIMQHSAQGDNFVIFGNTPYFVGRALKLLSSTDETSANYRRIIDFPFSGSPNSSRFDYVHNKDLVTPARFAHLEKRLRAAGLSKDNPKLLQVTTHFVDTVVTCGGPAYVIEAILRGYKDQPQAPNFHMICLGRLHYKKSQLFAHEISNKICDFSEPMFPKKWIFTFPTEENPHFEIPALEIALYGINMLAMLPTRDWRVFPEYGAYCWQDEYDYLIESNFPEHIQVLCQSVDVNIQYLIAQQAEEKIQ